MGRYPCTTFQFHVQSLLARYTSRSVHLVAVSREGQSLQFLDEVLQVAVVGLLQHDFEHLLSDLTDLGGLRVGGLSHLVLVALGESNRKETQDVAVVRLHVNVRFDQRLPFLDEGSQFVRGHVHAPKVGQAVLALRFLHS